MVVACGSLLWQVCGSGVKAARRDDSARRLRAASALLCLGLLRRDGAVCDVRWRSGLVQEAPMLAFQAAALHRALQKRREELQKSLLVSYAASPRSAVQLRRRYAVMKEAARARRR